MQITRNDFIKIFIKEGLFIGQRYRRMEDQKPRPVLAPNLDLTWILSVSQTGICGSRWVIFL